jgi:WD40-like Beta Propeller Repeat
VLTRPSRRPSRAAGNRAKVVQRRPLRSRRTHLQSQQGGAAHRLEGSIPSPPRLRRACKPGDPCRQPRSAAKRDSGSFAVTPGGTIACLPCLAAQELRDIELNLYRGRAKVYRGRAKAGPTFSPDGTRIAFVSHRDGNYEIYLMNADGSDKWRLTHNPAQDRQPAFSPDGKRIAFASDRTGNFEIYVMNVDGPTGTASPTGAMWTMTPPSSRTGRRSRSSGWEPDSTTSSRCGPTGPISAA